MSDSPRNPQLEPADVCLTVSRPDTLAIAMCVGAAIEIIEDEEIAARLRELHRRILTTPGVLLPAGSRGTRFSPRRASGSSTASRTMCSRRLLRRLGRDRRSLRQRLAHPHLPRALVDAVNHLETRVLVEFRDLCEYAHFGVCSCCGRFRDTDERPLWVRARRAAGPYVCFDCFGEHGPAILRRRAAA